MQLPPKKGQNLPPLPPLKASTVLAISTFHPPRDVLGQPRLLPKGSSNAQSSNSGSSKITLILINFVCDYSVKFLPSSFPGSSVFLPRERKRGDLGARLNFLSSKVQKKLMIIPELSNARARCKTCPFIHHIETTSGLKRSYKTTIHFTCTTYTYFKKKKNVIYWRRRKTTSLD